MERIGIVITGLWLCLICVLISLKWDDALNMSLNEWGDFLAGVTAPMAFLWLIIGYMLQRKELHLNTEALTLSKDEIKRQANELEQQTEYQRIQAKAARDQSREISRRISQERWESKAQRQKNKSSMDVS